MTASLTAWNDYYLDNIRRKSAEFAMSKRRSLHLPIAAKAVLLIAVLGLLSIAANWFCLQRLDELARLNALVSEHIAPARLALAKPKPPSSRSGPDL